MKIADRDIGPGFPPYIISEISANHNGSAQEGFRLLEAAADCGASACKIQCYTAEELAFPSNEKIKDGNWRGYSLYELYSKAQTPPKLVKDLFNYSLKNKITIFASVFSLEGVSVVVELGAPAIKIASFELVDLPLIQRAAETGLPMIISTGMGSTGEIIDAINTVYKVSTKRDNLALLHCISSYPASASEANLPALGPLSSLLGGSHVVGFSDHTLGIGTACAAVSLGASLIEKHFIIDRNSGGPDASFSMEPSEFSRLVVACNEAYEAIKPRLPVQSPNLSYRKSLFVVQDVSCGDSFSSKNVRALRPSSGLSPKFYPSVLAGVATQDLKAGCPLHSYMVSTLA